MMKRKLTLVAALILLITTLSAIGPAAAFDDAADNETEVTDAVDSGVAWLLTQQDGAGCWSSQGVTTGVTALAMLAIINSSPTGYSGLGAAEQTAVDGGTSCLLARVQGDGTITDGTGLSTYNTSIAIWALSEVPDNGPEGVAIAGGRTWLLASQRNDGSGRADTGGHVNNGGWYYESDTLAGFVEHSNSSFAMQALAVTGSIPNATADLAAGFWTCLQNRLASCGTQTALDGGFIYSHQFTKGGSRSSQTGSGVFAMVLSGIAAGDGRVLDGLAFLDEALDQHAGRNMLHNDAGNIEPLDNLHWSTNTDLIHYAQWAITKAYELAGVADDVNDSNNWFYKIADYLIHEQNLDGSWPASDREDQILATSFALLTLERVTPPPPEIEVPVDVKPTSCRNPFNVGKKGVMPVAILGTADFDVTQVDPATVALEGVAPLRWSLGDVATPFEPFTGKEDPFDCTTEGPDGFVDLTFKFDAQEMTAALGAVADGDVVILHLTGNLSPDFGGTPLLGEDVIVILKKK
jgi:hypothetical protein